MDQFRTPITAWAFVNSLHKYYNRRNRDGERLGQHLCITFNITDAKLYYETQDKIATEYFVGTYMDPS